MEILKILKIISALGLGVSLFFTFFGEVQNHTGDPRGFTPRYKEYHLSAQESGRQE